MDNALYRDGHRVDCGVPVQDLAGIRTQVLGPKDFVWIGLHEPTAEELDTAQDLYDLHPLAIEDALHAHQRPKVERYGDSLFIVVKTLWYVDETDQVETGEINLFVGDRFVITVRHGEGGSLSEARRRLESTTGMLEHGPSAVVYAVCDSVVDHYGEVARELTNDVDEVESSVFSTHRTNDSARIYTLKRELGEMRRAVHPLREPMDRFARGAARVIDPEAGPYFRDISDHLAHLAETIEGLDLLLSTAFEAHIAQISIQQNDDMRKISAGVALVAAPTMIAGIYGMNLKLTPSPTASYGFWYALGLMGVAILLLFWLFKRNDWL